MEARKKNEPAATTTASIEAKCATIIIITFVKRHYFLLLQQHHILVVYSFSLKHHDSFNTWIYWCSLTENWRRWECCSNFSFFSVWTFIRANNNNQYQRGWDGMRCDALCSLTWWRRSMCVCLFSECENQMDICAYNSHAFGMGRIFVMRFHLICDMMSNFNLIWAPVSTVWLHLILPIIMAD